MASSALWHLVQLRRATAPTCAHGVACQSGLGCAVWRCTSGVEEHSAASNSVMPCRHTIADEQRAHVAKQQREGTCKSRSAAAAPHEAHCAPNVHGSRSLGLHCCGTTCASTLLRSCTRCGVTAMLSSAWHVGHAACADALGLRELATASVRLTCGKIMLAAELHRRHDTCTGCSDCHLHGPVHCQDGHTTETSMRWYTRFAMGVRSMTSTTQCLHCTTHPQQFDKQGARTVLGCWHVHTARSEADLERELDGLQAIDAAESEACHEDDQRSAQALCLVGIGWVALGLRNSRCVVPCGGAPECICSFRIDAFSVKLSPVRHPRGVCMLQSMPKIEN